jgi:hypothetical protein
MHFKRFKGCFALQIVIKMIDLGNRKPKDFILYCDQNISKHYNKCMIPLNFYRIKL